MQKYTASMPSSTIEQGLPPLQETPKFPTQQAQSQEETSFQSIPTKRLLPPYQIKQLTPEEISYSASLKEYQTIHKNRP
jgi:hypothetical protein